MFPSTNDKVLLFHAFVCSVGWIMSAQFHARETKTSEKMDYLGALAIVYSNTFSLFIAKFRAQKQPDWVGAFCMLLLSRLFNAK
ncbi:unnamed protein product [Oikopleura dioica]|uniref:Post-GPI attachment to proteins factor 3 n=1 Tax=Oikopleura dioica TaxID=34765 RepID=E4Z5Y3_OIKDI|nr:unnamed protein product [Oikopleura dioica]